MRSERRGPRPLALHIAHAEWAWRTGNPHRLFEFYQGVGVYRRHPYRRHIRQRPTVWRSGGCRLLDFGPEDGWPMLAVPSLINRAYILDLMPEASLLDYLGGLGIRPLLLDWGEGTVADRRLTLDGLILERMRPALDWVRRTTGKRPLVLGYCMGGTLATALACLDQDRMAGLALLAAPWNFHREDHAEVQAAWRDHALASCTGALGSAPVDLLQALFAQIDPMNVPNKFSNFARLAPTSSAATRFVAIEDWLNDGVSLSAEVAAECFLGWYGDNKPARGAWKVDGDPIRPERLDVPVCFAIPERDRIVPPDSALDLADAVGNGETIRPKAGHVGMVVGRNAKASLWAPLAHWLRRIAAMQKNPW